MKIKTPIETKVDNLVSNPYFYRNLDNTFIYGYYNNYNIPLTHENRNNVGVQYKFDWVKKEK